MHDEPVDARAKNFAPVVPFYPYGIVVDKNGRRFFDEGGGLVHETCMWFARDMYFKTPNSIAYAILDSRLFEIAEYQRAIRSEVPPVRADPRPVRRRRDHRAFLCDCAKRSFGASRLSVRRDCRM